jgi:hypothetical protein
MLKQVLVCVMAALALHVSASELPGKDESPKEGAAAILKLLADRNYADLLKTRYTEWFKAEEEGDEDKAIKQLSAMFEKNHGTLVSVYEQLATAEFELGTNDHPLKTETGTIATATIKVGGKEAPFRLYQMKSGQWGFHL